MRVDIDLTNFTAGELSPRLKGRTDVVKYYNGLDTMLNMVTLPQGGAQRRPGTVYVTQAILQSSASRLRRFIFSTVQAYMLEFGAYTIRVLMNDAMIINADGSQVVVNTPYQPTDLAALKFTQSADTLYICHPRYPTMTLTRSSHYVWTLSPLVTRDGPYLNVNTTTTTLTTGRVATGNVVVTANSVVGLNSSPSSAGVGFLPTDIGRHIRIKLSSLWGWLIITGYNSPTQVIATVQGAVNSGAAGALDGAAWQGNTVYVTGTIVTPDGVNYYQAIVGGISSAAAPPSGTGTAIADNTVTWKNVAAPLFNTTTWSLGKWSNTTGWPSVPTFWQQRLMLAASTNQPNALDGSVSGDFTNFAPTMADGTEVATNALDWLISDDQVNAIHWISAAGSAQAAQLGIGTSGGEDIMQAASTSAELTPTSVQVYRETALGSAANVDPLRIGKALLFANRPGRKVHEWTFQWTVNGYLGPDVTVDSEHITKSGIAQMVYQQSPYSIIWAILNDGTLIGFTYLSDQKIQAWHRHRLGGQYFGGPPRVESIDVIPSQDGSYDELWLQVVREINGIASRSIEVMSAFFDGATTSIEQAVMVDAAVSSALTYPNAFMQPAASSGTGVNFLAAAPVFTSGQVNALIRINGGIAIVRAYVNALNVTCDWYVPAATNPIGAPGAWSCTTPHSSFSGVSYLNGEPLQIMGDGADFGTQVSTNGAVVLPAGYSATFATIGLPYTYRLLTMPFEPQRAAAASSQGKAKRLDTLYLRLFESLGCNFGRQVTDPLTGSITDVTEPLETRSAADPMGQAPPLYSGLQRLKLPGGYDQECQILVTGSGPYPITVLAITAKADVGEMPQP
ncbi:MAG TPA: hypothetical protein VNT30_09395 [Stellaceae bacterium]|nr:hypothetical protein [Stellaceae bacterium]